MMRFLVFAFFVAYLSNMMVYDRGSTAKRDEVIAAASTRFSELRFANVSTAFVAKQT